ncbi:MAG TPA: benzoate-CoA ligase family protein [Blastocatellia bacterium]
MPEKFNLYDYFLGEGRLARIGDNQAILFRGRSFSYSDLNGDVLHWAARLANSGLGPSDRVALYLYDSPDQIAAFLAAMSLGAIAVPLNTFLPPRDVNFILADSGATAVVAETELTDRLGGAASSLGTAPALIEIDTESRHCLDSHRTGGLVRTSANTTRTTPAFILYTSGSTGTPKGVLHTHGSIPATVDSYCRTVLHLQPGDRIYSASRMFFAYGLGNSFSFPLASGATTILHTERATPDTVAAVLDSYAPTVFFGVPALYQALIDLKKHGAAVNTSSLRLCVSAGEALPARVFEDWKRLFGLSILDGIGSTEMLHIFISNRPGEEQPGSTGSVVMAYQADLRDEDGRSIDGDGTGNLWVKGDSAFAEYWNLPDLTLSTKREGWVRTGDTYRRESSYFFHVGRSDDCFKVKGLWVSPVEVEGALIEHEKVKEAAVVQDLDPAGLATVHAFIVIGKDGDPQGLEDDLRSHVARRLAGHKVPSAITVVDELPRTATGKVQRFKLRLDKETTSR